jgi:multiple sugar transport system ATP-binding protein
MTEPTDGGALPGVTGSGVVELTASRGRTPVLHGVTLLAGEGELLVVLGASGCGKSTLLRAIAGLDRIDAGDVVIRGRRVTELPPGRRGISMVFESTALVPFFDVAKNLGWGLRVSGVDEEEVKNRVYERARQLRLRRLLPRRPAGLSSGERGLVGIGRALVARPQTFLFDEPLAHLDSAERGQVRRQIVDAVRSLGVTTIYVTHDQAEALAIADRIAVMEAGRIVQLAPPLELYNRPANLMVASFVGSPSIGLLPARLVSSGGLAGFEVGRRTVPLWMPVPPALAGHVGREVVLGLRPEDVREATGQGANPDLVTLQGVVTCVEYTGRQNVVSAAIDVQAGPGSSASLPDGEAPMLRSLFPPRAAVQRGEPVWLAVQGARTHVFDAVTGEALWHPTGDGR